MSSQFNATFSRWSRYQLGTNLSEWKFLSAIYSSVHFLSHSKPSPWVHSLFIRNGFSVRAIFFFVSFRYQPKYWSNSRLNDFSVFRRNIELIWLQLNQVGIFGGEKAIDKGTDRPSQLRTTAAHNSGVADSSQTAPARVCVCVFSIDSIEHNIDLS